MKDRSIKRQLLAAMFLTSLVVLLLSCIVLVSYELASYKRTMARSLRILSVILAENSSATVAFKDQDLAKKVLQSLKAQPDVVAAAFFDERGNLYASYPSPPPAGFSPAFPGRFGLHVEGQNLVVWQPLVQKGAQVGTLFIQEDLSGIYARLLVYSLFLFLLLAGCAAVAFLLAKFFQARISQPILSLAGTARLVSEKKDYSVRARKTSQDELGLLTDAFNEMLEQIQQREAALREAQQQLQRHAGELERRVTERTARLREMIGELEAFSYTLTHDLRAPLRSMQGFASALQEDYHDKLGPEGADYIQRILTSARRMDLLIQDVLTLSRISRAEMSLKPVDTERLVSGILDSYPGFQPPQAEIQVEGPLPPVLANEAALTQCISNYLTNATKFVKPGVGPRVVISANEANGNVQINFRDNGIGVPAEAREKIFGMFERLSREYEGTGIGLAIVKKAAERMGGTVGVSSELGKGSTFWLKLRRG